MPQPPRAVTMIEPAVEGDSGAGMSATLAMLANIDLAGSLQTLCDQVNAQHESLREQVSAQQSLADARHKEILASQSALKGWILRSVSFEEQIASLEDRILTLERRDASRESKLSLKDSPAPIEGSAVVQVESNKESQRPEEKMSLQHSLSARFVDMEYKIQPSIWDASMLIFFRFPPESSPLGGFADKLALLITFCTNLCIQVTLVLSIYLGMLDFGPEVESPTLLGDYRASLDLMPPKLVNGINVPMAELFCNIDLWGWEQSVFEDLYKYTRPSFSFSRLEIPGKWLSFLGMCVWVCNIFSDYEAMVMHLRGILDMPASLDSPEVSRISGQPSGKGFQVEGVSRRTRIGMLLLIITPRFLINVSLLYVGCKYIAQTYVFSDIVLNCVAIMFVLMMDEILHDVFLPKPIRNVVVSFSPIPVRSFTLDGRWGGLDIGDGIRWLLMFIVLVGSWYVWLKPTVEDLKHAVGMLCPMSV